MKPGLYFKDEMSMTLEGERYPYYAFELTEEQAKKLENLTPEIYSTNGQKYFKVERGNGKSTSKVAMFILFR